MKLEEFNQYSDLIRSYDEQAVILWGAQSRQSVTKECLDELARKAAGPWSKRVRKALRALHPGWSLGVMKIYASVDHSKSPMTASVQVNLQMHYTAGSQRISLTASSTLDQADMMLDELKNRFSQTPP